MGYLPEVCVYLHRPVNSYAFIFTVMYYAENVQTAWNAFDELIPLEGRIKNGHGYIQLQLLGVQLYTQSLLCIHTQQTVSVVHTHSANSLCCAYTLSKQSLLCIHTQQTVSIVHTHSANSLCCAYTLSKQSLLCIHTQQTVSIVHTHSANSLCCAYTLSKQSLLCIHTQQSLLCIHTRQRGNMDHACSLFTKLVKLHFIYKVIVLQAVLLFTRSTYTAETLQIYCTLHNCKWFSE